MPDEIEPGCCEERRGQIAGHAFGVLIGIIVGLAVTSSLTAHFPQAYTAGSPWYSWRIIFSEALDAMFILIALLGTDTSSTEETAYILFSGANLGGAALTFLLFFFYLGRLVVAGVWNGCFVDLLDGTVQQGEVGEEYRCCFILTPPPFHLHAETPTGTSSGARGPFQRGARS